MRNKPTPGAVIAEALLRTVTDPQAAASITGDLLEERARGTQRFVLDLVSSVLRLGIGAIASMPLYAAAVLVAALALWGTCYATVRLLLVEFGWPGLAGDFAGGSVAAAIRGTGLMFALIGASLGTGALLAATRTYLRLNPVLPLAGLFLGLVPVLILADLSAGTLSWHCLLSYVLIIPLCYALPLFAGTMLLQRNRQVSR